MSLLVSLTHQSANISYPAKVDGVLGAQEAEWQTNKSDSIWYVLTAHACLSAIFQPHVHQKHHQSLMDRSCLMLMIIEWMMWREKKIRRVDFLSLWSHCEEHEQFAWNSSHLLACWCNMRFRSRIHQGSQTSVCLVHHNVGFYNIINILSSILS